MKTFPWKKLLLVLAAGVVVYAVYSIWQAFQKGERTLLGLLGAPFSAISDAWAAITGLFSSSDPSVPAVNALPVAGLSPTQTLLSTPGDTSANQPLVMPDGSTFSVQTFQSQFPGLYN